MGADVEIKITIRGEEVSAGNAQQADVSGAPSPSPDMAGALGTAIGSDAQGAPSPSPDMAGALGAATGAGDMPPSPVDALGASGLDSGSAPSPTMDGAGTSTAAASALPEPVPLDDIDSLGSSQGAASAGLGEVPEPQGGPE